MVNGLLGHPAAGVVERDRHALDELLERRAIAIRAKAVCELARGVISPPRSVASPLFMLRRISGGMCHDAAAPTP